MNLSLRDLNSQKAGLAAELKLVYMLDHFESLIVSYTLSLCSIPHKVQHKF